jgi:glutamyl/glutaminyl-tRNA synthetase
MGESDVVQEVSARLEKHELKGDISFIKKVSKIIFEHISKWGDIDTMVGEGELSFYFSAPEYESSLLSWKGDALENSKKHLEWVREKISSSNENDFDSSDTTKALIFDYATEQGRGNVLWPLRVALSGREKSPDPFTLLYVFGKDESIKRINNALSKI